MEKLFNRYNLLSELDNHNKIWDVLIIGGGATGLGAALESVSRNYSTLLLEKYDYTAGTSSRSTKLVHGGVRYLAQGDIFLVLEALRERGLLLKNAPHLTRNQKFLIPSYKWWYKPFYTMGLKFYDLLSGRLSLGKSQTLSRKKTIEALPTVKKEGLNGGILYHDGQFDDARLGLNIAQTIIEKGGVPLNYVEVVGFLKEGGKIAGVRAVDSQSGKEYYIRAKSVLNATGVFVDDILKKDDPQTKDIVMPSQGVHLVVDGEFLQSDHAMLIPATSDGRVLFAVPWHDKVIIGTTDLPKQKALIEPLATREEIDFILETAGRYLTKKPTRKDVKSVFAGLRPLAAPEKDVEGKTKEISRSHKIIVSKSGLVTIIGGKWTTYREMGEQVIDKMAKLANLPKKESITEHLKIHAYKEDVDFNDPWYFYGEDILELDKIIKEDSSFGELLSEELKISKAQIILAVRNELAVNVIDVLARRTRALFLNSSESKRIAPLVASLMARELNKDSDWEKEQVEFFNDIAKGYILNHDS